MTKHAISAILALLTPILIWANEFPLCQIREYGVNEGLIGTTMNILQDNKGFMWVSTWNGLNKFDGYTFKNFKAFSGDNCALTNNRITYIHQGVYDDIWCCTYDKRVYLFDYKKEQFIDVLLLAEEKLNYTNTVLKLYPLKKGVVWVVCDNGYSFRVDEQLCKTGEGIECYRSSKQDFKGGNISFIHQDSDGDEWILTDKGIFVIGNKKIENGSFFDSIQEIDKYIFLFSASGKMAYYDKEKQYLRFIEIPYAINTINSTGFINQNILGISTDNGIILYHFVENEFQQMNVSASSGLSNAVHSFYKDKQEELWVYTDSPGVTRIELDTGNKQHFPVLKQAEITYDRNNTNIIFEDKTGTLWLVPNEGHLCYYDRSANRLKTYHLALNQTTSPFVPFVYTHYIDNQDNFWFTSKHGIIKMSFFIPTYTLNKIDNGLETRAFYLDKWKRFWVSTKSGLLRIYDEKGKLEGYLTPEGTISEQSKPFIGNAYCFFEDKEGNIWIGTKSDGLVCLKEKDKKKYVVTRYLHNPEDAYSISDNSIYSVFQDKKGRIWVGTYGGGLNLMQDTEQGNLYFIHSGNKMKNYPASYAQKVRYVTQTAEGIMMVGTTEGLLTFSESFAQPEEIKFYRNIRQKDISSSLGSNDVMHIYIDSKQDIYLSTFTGGISKVISGNLLSERIEFRSYGVKDGLASDLAFSMIEDANHSLWVVLENSIAKFDSRSETFDNYDFRFLQKGSHLSEAIPVFNEEGQLIIGSNRGFIEIEPELMKKSEYVPPISFTGMKIHGISSDLNIDDLDVLTLHPSQRDVTFQFAAFDYTEPREIYYAYRLEGLEKNWNYADNSRSANYINLPAGEYDLQIRSTNSDGVWTDNIRTLTVSVLPTFWETPYAWLVYILLFIFLTGTITYVLFYIYRLRHRVSMEQHLLDIKLKFFTNVSHELRTPLTLIAGPVTEVLDNEPLSAVAHRHLSIVQNNTNRMLRLINQILDFRKIENKKMKVLLEETDIIALLHRIMENFYLTAEEKQIDFQLQTDRESLYIWVDRDKFDKIFFNLLSNAFKYTPSDKAITVSVITGSEQVSVAVIDEGCGIDPKKQKSLFQRFETLSSFGKFSSGIGLSLVKELLDLHHGCIEVKSQSGVGSRFDVTLPLSREVFEGDPLVEFSTSHAEQMRTPVEVLPEQKNGIKQKSDTEQEADYENQDKLAVLIVEDNEELRSFLRDILTVNYLVVEAVNGQEGLEYARRDIPDIIIADVMMPVMDGMEMVKEVKKDRNICHIPIILLTAKSSMEDKISGITQGIDDYITKPFSATYLRTRIASLLQQRKLLQEVYRNSLSTQERISSSISLNPSQPQIASYDELFLQQVMDFIEEQMDNADLTIDDFAAALGLGRTVFYKKLKSIVGLAPVDFIRDIRIKRAAQLLELSEYNFSQIAYMTGFNDPKYFSRCFKKQMGLTPSEYRNSHGS